VLDWRIYYEKGDTFDSSMGSPADAPGWGVQAVVFNHHEVGRKILTGYDYYVYRRETGWVGVMGEVGIIEYVINVPFGASNGVEAVKSGRMLSADPYHEIAQAAHDDPDFRPKSVRSSDESPGLKR